MSIFAQSPLHTVGREEKSDCLIELQLASSGGRAIKVHSSVQELYGNQIRITLESALDFFAISHGKLVIRDFGALDHVLKARIEAAVRAACGDQVPALLPEPRIALPPKPASRLRRSRLYLPGNQPDLALNAGLFQADAIILDLEDSVAPPHKAAARILVRNTLASIDFGRSERIVRINPLSSPYGQDDLLQIVAAQPDTLLIPKCENAVDIRSVEERVSQLEQTHGIDRKISFMPLIESARGVMMAQEIAFASERNCALCFGAEDFSADIGAERSQEGKESLVARSLIVLAAKAARIQVLDTVYSDVENITGLIESTRESLQLGFDGRGVIHPSQIRPIHDIFSPSAEQIEKARLIIQAVEEAKSKGSGVAALGSKMIDAPVVARAQKVLSMARAAGLLEPDRES
ncbi:HpcH/HpaI aldolase/citrate lyase family protein [candidate division KSB1 bacterium]|nr:HpcH/HpaI aldolase/citrate lyase family protein [candidate division KSB1 bacterium]